MPESIKKVTVLATAITAALVLMTPALITTGAYAANPHFIGQPNCSVDSAGNLDCNGKIAGLGNVEEVQPSEGFDCPNPNWRIVLVSITYDNVSVIIDGDELPIGGPFSRTLIVV